MSIERLIYGSLPLGIEGENPGFQEYTYTSGYPSLKAENRDIHGRITTMYTPPETISYSDLYMEKVVETSANFTERVRLSNQASNQAPNYHPNSLTFYHETINGDIKAVFVYAKGMIEWSMSRGVAPYYSAVICDTNYIKKYPVLYCSSPVVCCDIKREAFFLPSAAINEKAEFDVSKLVKPRLLGNLSSLDSPNDVCLEHQAGFKEITSSDIISFIREGDNLQILKNMVSSLIQHKEGNEAKRLIITDQKDKIIMWIAAISYVFTLESALNISFTTYGFKIRDYDINGVFVPELNNAQKIDESIDVTEYDYNKYYQDHSVYDFYQKSYGEAVDVYDNMFMSLIENSFTISEQALEQYKDYITTATTYRAINAAYMDGAILFMFVEKNKKLSAGQMKTALDFSKSYSTKSAKANILQKLMQLYKQYVSDADTIEIVIDYIRHCVNEGIIQQKQIEAVFMRDVKNAFLDYERVSFDDFSKQGQIAEKFCGFADGQMELAFVKSIGIDQLYSLIDPLRVKKDIQRISYIHTSVAHFVNNGSGNYRNGGTEQKIACAITSIFVNGETTDNEKRLDALVSKTSQIITDCTSQFFYYDSIFHMLVKKRIYKAIQKYGQTHCKGIFAVDK